ncbi:MAG TPA: hypothetical protein VG458_06525, partial [Solirubrobacterales bacterium]|nr:hypothetical protein [Solirubrobacterales bacterium]
MALIAALIAPQAQAREGSLDRAFGTGGRVTLDGAARSYFTVSREGGVVLMKQGRVVVLTTEGAPDQRFGPDGSFRIPARLDGWSFWPTDVAFDSLGRVRLFGTVYPQGEGTIRVGPYLEPIQISRAAVVGLLPDGTVDPGFGSGGALVSDFGMRSEDPTLQDVSEPTTGLYSGVIDSRDRLLVVLGTVSGNAPCNGHSGYASKPRQIARLTPTGVLDPEFGGGDGLSPSFPEFEGNPRVELLVNAADQPVAAGLRSIGCPAGASVIRLDEAGAPLPGYGVEARRDFRGLRPAVLAPDGSAILRDQRSPTRKLRRVTPEGLIDPGFGAGGVVKLRMPPGADRSMEATAVDSQGRVLLAGSYSLPVSGPGKKRAFIVVERLLSSGAPDLG